MSYILQFLGRVHIILLFDVSRIIYDRGVDSSTIVLSVLQSQLYTASPGFTGGKSVAYDEIVIFYLLLLLCFVSLNNC